MLLRDGSITKSQYDTFYKNPLDLREDGEGYMAIRNGLNRLAQTDSVEGGQSLTIGSEYILKKKNDDEILSLNLATNFRDAHDSRLPTNSKLGNKTSDIVGEFNINPSKYINFEPQGERRSFSLNIIFGNKNNENDNKS